MANTISLLSASLQAVNTIRLTYSAFPLTASANGANDATNIANYTVIGAGTSAIVSVNTVPDHPECVDLVLLNSLQPGIWVITANNVQMYDGTPLAVSSTSFNVAAQDLVSVRNVGPANSGAEGLIRKHLSTAFRGKAWNALIAALALSDRYNWDNAKAAFNQLWRSTANSIYLDRRAADYGIRRPPSVGLSDDSFRKLAIKAAANKLTPESLLEVLEVFYGGASVRASNSSTATSPFTLANGYDLQILIDGKQSINVVFATSDFVNIAQATAAEVAAAITRACVAAGSKAYAYAFTDPVSQTTSVQVVSASLGLGSSVQITGGHAQNALRFPSLVQNTGLDATGITGSLGWTITIPQTNTARIQQTRRINYVAQSSAMGTSPWAASGTGTGTVPTITNNFAASPDSAATATRLQFSIGAGTTASDRSVVSQQASIPSGTYTYSLWLKSNTGSNQTVAIEAISGTPSVVTVTTAWQRFTVTTAWTTPNTVATLGCIGLRGTYGAGSSCDILAWGAQFEAGSVATDYIATTTTSAFAIGTFNGFPVSEGPIVYSYSFTGCTITSQTAVAPNGTNTANVLVYDGSGSAGGVRANRNAAAYVNGPTSSSLALAGQPYTVSAWLRSDTPITVRILPNVNGGKFVTCNVTSTWQRFSVTDTATSSGLLQFQLASAVGDNTPFTLYIWGIQGEPSAVMNSYVKTTGSPASGPVVDLSQVQVGDYFNLYGTAYSVANQGSFVVSNVFYGGSTNQYVEVTNINAVAESKSGVASDVADTFFFRPTETSIYSAANPVIVSQKGNEVDIVLPATSSGVSRTKNSGAYFQPTASVSTISTLSRSATGLVTATTLVPHNLVVGQQIILDNALAANTSATVNAGGATTLKASNTTIFDQMAVTQPPISSITTGRDSGVQITLPDGSVLVLGGTDRSATTFADGCTLSMPSSSVIADGSTQWNFSFLATSNTPAGAGYFQAGCAVPSIGTAVPSGNGAFITGGAATFNSLSTGRSTVFFYDKNGDHNHFKASADLTSISWSKTAILSTTGNASTAPNGTVTASLIVEDTTNSNHYVQQSVVMNPSTRYIRSAYAKQTGSGTPRHMMLQVRTVDGTFRNATFDLTNGLVSNTVNVSASGIQSVGSGWYRCWIVVDSGTGTNTPNDSLQISNTTGFTNVYTGDGVSGLYIWGQQFEPVASSVTTPSTYIGTTTLPAGWVQGGNLNVARSLGVAVYVPSNKRVVLAGGVAASNSNPTAAVDLYDATTGTNLGNTTLASARNWAAAYVVPNTSKVVVIGGDTGSGNYTATCEIIDTSTNTPGISGTGRMAYARGNFGSVQLPDGRILVAGGIGQADTANGAPNIRLNSCELYDPTTGCWSPAGQLAIARSHCVAIYLPTSNKVVVGFGSDGSVALSSCEIYDVTTGVWSMAPYSGTSARVAPVSGPVAKNGNGVVWGGTLGTSAVANMEILVPASDTFAAGRLNGQSYTISAVPTPTSFQFQSDTPIYTKATGMTAIAATAPKSVVPGPYIFDPKNGVSVTGTETTTTATIFRNSSVQSIGVASTSGFSASGGYIAFNFGTGTSLSPVKYLGVLGNTLLLDPSYTFPVGVVSGSRVTLLAATTPFVPTHPESVGSFYATASSAGRTAATTVLKANAAAGVNVNISVNYPGDRGLGGEGQPAHGAPKLTDAVTVWGSDDMDGDVRTARSN